MQVMGRTTRLTSDSLGHHFTASATLPHPVLFRDFALKGTFRHGPPAPITDGLIDRIVGGGTSRSGRLLPATELIEVLQELGRQLRHEDLRLILSEPKHDLVQVEVANEFGWLRMVMVDFPQHAQQRLPDDSLGVVVKPLRHLHDERRGRS